MVMVMDPLGKPLIVEERGLAGVWVPGRASTRSRASREVNGNSVICRPVMVLPMFAVCVCKTSPPPTIVTVSCGAPGSSVTLTVVGVPTLTLTFVTSDFLKPDVAWTVKV